MRLLSDAGRSQAISWLRKSMRGRGYDVVRYPSRSGIEYQRHALFEALGVTCVLDVGARYGDFGGKLRSLGYAGRIVSFEPVARNFAVLEGRVDDAWHVHRLALGSKAERLVISNSVEPGCESFLRPSEYGMRHFGRYLDPVGEEEVEVTTLDAVFEGAVAGLTTPRIFLKVDTQGWDREVLLGAESSLPRIDALQLELSVMGLYEEEPTYLEQLSFVAERGFRPIWFEPVILDRHQRPPEFDCILCRSPELDTPAGGVRAG
jgi:FkbM family methyltransferase